VMPTDTEVVPRRWERQNTESIIRLVLDPARFKTDNSALALDISLYGARIRTTLTLSPGEWVGVVPKGDFPHAIPAPVVWAQEDSYSHWTFAGVEFIDKHLTQKAA
jgi:PilZ domain